MTAVLTEGIPRRCGIDEVFASPFIELIALAPRNPLVRGLILAQTGRMPEPERATFDQIKEWVETTCDKKVRPSNHLNVPGVPVRDGIVIKVEFGETEHGRAHYSVNRSGTDEFVVDAEELLICVRGAVGEGRGLDGVVDRIAGLIDEDAWNRCDPSLEDYGEYDYDDHDAGDPENATIEFSRAQIRDRLLTFLQVRHPDLLEELA